MRSGFSFSWMRGIHFLAVSTMSANFMPDQNWGGSQLGILGVTMPRMAILTPLRTITLYGVK
jgi:hypothetical protein